MQAAGGVGARVDALLPTLELQVLGSVVALVVLFALGEGIRRVGPSLKGRFGDIAVESVQTTVISLLAVLLAAFLVVVWDAVDQVMLVLEVLRFGRREVVKAVITLAVLAGGYTFTRATKRAIVRLGRERSAISEHQQEVAHHLVQISTLVLVGFAVLSLWRVPVENLLLGAGFLGLVLGLAARQTLGAVLAGFVVLFSRPFELGDWVQIGDHEGVVQDITIVNTRLKTYDDEVVMVPNDIVTSTEVVNRSRLGRYRVEADVGVDYGTDIDHAAAVAEEALESADIPLEHPTPHVVLTEFGDSSVGLRLRFWIDNPSATRMWQAKTEVIEAVKDAFDEEGITIPFPQRTLMARNETGGFRLAGGFEPGETERPADETDGEAADEEADEESDDEGRSEADGESDHADGSDHDESTDDEGTAE